MLKRLYLANGTLQTPLSKTAEDISVDAGLATYILSILSIGDWAYLTIQFMGAFEVIKVYVDYTGLAVSRGQDGTSQQAFPAGANVVYSVTQAEIQDATPAAEVNLYADITSPITVSLGWVINYPAPTVEYEGGIKAYFSAEDAVLHLDNWYPAAGCVSIAGNGAPLIGGPFFYLTSQPYSVQAFDWMAPNPNAGQDGGAGGNFGFGNIWALTQPSVTDPTMLQSDPGINYMYIFGSQGSFAVTDGYIGTSTGINSGEIFGSQGNFGVVEPSLMSSNLYILQALLYGSEVSYNYGIDEYIASSMSVGNATVQ